MGKREKLGNHANSGTTITYPVLTRMGTEDAGGEVIYLYGEEPLHQSCSKEFEKDPASEKSHSKNYFIDI